MKPIPDSLLPQNGPIPGRPWWSYHPVGAIRTDGQTTSTLRWAEELDEKQPLPEPRLYPGQVWASLDGSWMDTINYVSEKEVKTSIKSTGKPILERAAFLIFDPIGNQAPWSPAP